MHSVCTASYYGGIHRHHHHDRRQKSTSAATRHGTREGTWLPQTQRLSSTVRDLCKEDSALINYAKNIFIGVRHKNFNVNSLKFILCLSNTINSYFRIDIDTIIHNIALPGIKKFEEYFKKNKFIF